MLMLAELPEVVTVFERFFQLEYSESYTFNMHGDVRIEEYQYTVCHLKTLGSELQHLHFNCGNQVIGVDSYAGDMYGNSHSQLLEIPATHKLLQYFQSLNTCRNEDMSLKVYRHVYIANFEADLCLSNV